MRDAAAQRKYNQATKEQSEFVLHKSFFFPFAESTVNGIRGQSCGRNPAHKSGPMRDNEKRRCAANAVKVNANFCEMICHG